jgi:hypothetical protein
LLATFMVLNPSPTTHGCQIPVVLARNLMKCMPLPWFFITASSEEDSYVYVKSESNQVTASLS